jgi:hypothetical protein
MARAAVCARAAYLLSLLLSLCVASGALAARKTLQFG